VAKFVRIFCNILIDSPPANSLVVS
jgi:hypothetical protein